jgi:preprotein translocase SecF subunit
VPFELVPPGTHIDFLGKRRLCAALSILALLISLVAIPVRGMMAPGSSLEGMGTLEKAGAILSRGVRLGIDFAGGTELVERFEKGAAVDEGAIRSVVSRCGVSDPTVIRYGETEEAEFLIRFRQAPDAELAPASADCPISDEQRAELVEAAATGTGDDEEAVGGGTGEMIDRLTMALANEFGSVEMRRAEFVGPRVGAELRRDGFKAMALAGLLILVYIAFRFSTRFAPGAIVALVHDVSITAGCFVILGMEFDLRVLAALLAIMGYSLNDTIIIYDRIRENLELHTKFDLVDVLNRSVNQTLARTVLTSGTTLAAVLSLLFLGGEVIRPFAVAMSIGIVVGTYSSIFIAAPTLLWLETRYGSATAADPGKTTAAGAAFVTRTAAPGGSTSETPRKKKRGKRKKKAGGAR